MQTRTILQALKNNIISSPEWRPTCTTLSRSGHVSRLRRYQSSLIGLPIDKCKMLGLNPDESITMEMVKTAYHAKLKKWHPDFFSEQASKKQAEEMTKQLNEAYKELTTIFSKK